MRGPGFAAFFLGVFSVLPASAQDTTAVPSTLFVPVGTVLTVTLQDRLSSDRNIPGDAFRAALLQPLVVDGWVVARPGQSVFGTVATARKAGRSSGASQLGLELTEMLLVDGQQIPIRTQLVQDYGPQSRGADVGAVAGGTILGTIIGAAIGDGKGAAIGAAAGATAGIVGVLSTRGRATEVYPEASLTFRLDAPLTISTARSQQAFVPVTPSDYDRAPALRPSTRPSVRKSHAVFFPPPFVYGYPYPSRHVVRSSSVLVVPHRYVVAPRPYISSGVHIGVSINRGRWSRW